MRCRTSDAAPAEGSNWLHGDRVACSCCLTLVSTRKVVQLLLHLQADTNTSELVQMRKPLSSVVFTFAFEHPGRLLLQAAVKAEWVMLPNVALNIRLQELHATQLERI